MSVHRHGTTGPGCAGTCCLRVADLGVNFGHEEVLRNATQQSEQMKHELDEARAAALAEAKIEAKDAARVYYDREAARIRAESGQEVSRHLMESKRQIYLRVRDQD